MSHGFHTTLKDNVTGSEDLKYLFSKYSAQKCLVFSLNSSVMF